MAKKYIIHPKAFRKIQGSRSRIILKNSVNLKYYLHMVQLRNTCIYSNDHKDCTRHVKCRFLPSHLFVVFSFSKRKIKPCKVKRNYDKPIRLILVTKTDSN